MPLYVIDIETDGLVSSKIHVMSIGFNQDGEWKVKSTSDYDHMREVMSNPDNTVVGHFFKVFDAPELERVLDFKIQATIIDTLALSWYIFPSRVQGTFGLEAFGKDYGIKKPKIEDWSNQTLEEYTHRCEEDVKINIKLWEDILERLLEVYDSKREAWNFIKYLMFKMDCLAEQQKQGCKIDINKVKENIAVLEPLRDEKETILKDVMPPGKILKTRPKVMYKKDGTISANGQKWFEYLTEKGLPIDTETVYDEPNPASISQLKDWLFSLGWEPDLYTDGSNGPVPQVRTKDKELTESVLLLAENEPSIQELDGYTVINHRLGVLKSFLDSSDEEGWAIAGASGFTNTLRLKHIKPIVNLPGVTGYGDLRDGRIIRECVVAPEGKILCGSDIVSLEDNTKRHYMWDYDPDYVTDQMTDGYDPHLDLAIRAGAVTVEEIPTLKANGALKPIRDIYKMANYSCIYGVGVAKLAKSVGIKPKEAKKLREAYWDRNWSIKQLPKDIRTKIVRDQMWLLNPVSKFWYSVRAEKDIFSTLNQGTGAFIFDCWIKYMNQGGLYPFLQYHDEVLIAINQEDSDDVKGILEESMSKVNELLNLNVEITVDCQFGSSYADCH